MNGALFGDAFAHHVWATTRLIDTCLDLNTRQLATARPGDYGSILETMRHLVEGRLRLPLDHDRDRGHLIGTEQMDLPELRGVMENDGVLWSGLLAHHLDSNALVKRDRRP
jgi:hypothetical protein